MSNTVLQIDNLWKEYRLGVITHHTLTRDLQSWWARIRGKEDPNSPVDNNVIMQNNDDDRFWALQNVSFEVKQGETLGIIGRNGAGKSTLLKILSQVTAPTKGAVRYKGRIASLLEVGTGFHPELTGRENIFLNGAILGMSKMDIRNKLDEIVAFAEIDKFIDTPVKRYSSGMYVRLAFAVAAHLEPEILIVDEVLAVGDAQFQKKCLGKMGEVGREGRTVLFVSHNMSAIRSLCERIIMLDKGFIAFMGLPTEGIDLYLKDAQQMNSVDFNLADYRRSGHLGTSLCIHRLVFNLGKKIYHGQPLMVEIHFECFADVEGVAFGVGFCNRDGVRIVTLDSDVPGDRKKFNKGDFGKAYFSLEELHLDPDNYNIDVGSRSNANVALDYLAQCGSVAVFPSDKTPDAISIRETGRGGVRFPTKWNFDVDNKYGSSAESWVECNKNKENAPL